MNTNQLQQDTKAQLLNTFVTTADSNRGRRFTLITLIPTISFVTVVGTIFGGQNNPTLQNLSLPLGIGGALLVTGLFIVALVSTKHDEQYQMDIQYMRASLADDLPHYVPEHGFLQAKTAADILYAATVGGWICLATWFTFPGFGPICALIGCVIAGGVSYVINKPQKTIVIA